ncbi:MAG TPA: carboxymuconolactone decarboxylase family protein [Thermoanaerobaculia bacterium]|nr:carboxymuconolactone decarboxylase family protein [Thermoanaerobaculia bacterium]
MATYRSRAEVENEIKETLGLVPSFFDRFPEETLDYEWTLFKRFELEEVNQIGPLSVVIPVKYRQLMGVALHSETKCHYCTLFHTEVAKLFGATDAEIQEAVHYAKHSLGLSAYLNGIRQDFDDFSDELRQIGEYLTQKPNSKEKAA